MSAAAEVPSAKRVHSPLPMWLTMFNSGFSGCVAWIFAHPFEVTKNKVILSPHTQPLGTVLKAAYDGGLYKGLSGGIGRQVVYSTCRLGFYDPVKSVIIRNKEATIAERAAAGAISGMMASCLSSPVEVCLVMQTKAAKSLSLLGAATTVFNDGGILAFWRGIIPLSLRAGVVGISQVAFYDQMRFMISRWDKENNKGLSQETQVVYASLMTGLFYSFVTMPIELSRVRISAFQKGAAGTAATAPPGMLAVLNGVLKNEGIKSIFRSFLPYYLRCSVHTIALFFILEKNNMIAKEYRDGWK